MFQTMLELLTVARLSWTVGLVVTVLVVRFLLTLHRHRSQFKNLPGPPHSYLFGHIPSLFKVLYTLPKGIAPQNFHLPVKEKYKLGDYYYLDMWPLADPILAILDVDLMNDVTVKPSLPKHYTIGEFIQHLGGPGNMVSAEGAEWKKWRSAFNPGFAASHLMTLVPDIVDQCNIFCNIMAERARKNELFRMEQASTKLTVDIIGKVVLDADFNSQSAPNELVDTVIHQVKWIDVGSAKFFPVDPVRYFVNTYNTWKMNRYIGPMLDERFESRASRGKTKRVIDLALEAYLKDIKGTSDHVDDIKRLDHTFKTAATSNMKTLIFAGHDTTSATICYAYYYLSKNSSMLAKARQELDDVFGSEKDAVADKLKADPYLLNKLDYMVCQQLVNLIPRNMLITAHLI